MSMERLTYDFCVGGNHCWQVHGADNLMCAEVCEQHEDSGCGNCPIKKAFDKLAAYEDTGLEPEYIKGFFTEDVVLNLAGDILGVSADRLQEMTQDGREGQQCVVLPCKVGDKVYVIDGGDYHNDYKPYVREKEVTEISWKKVRNGKDLGFGLILKGGDCNTSARYKISSIGKTVFLTREEAEAALKEAEG